MAKSLQLKYAIQAYLIINWCLFSTAYAAESPFVIGIEAIPAKAFLYVLALSIVGGAAGTLTKLSRPDIIVRNLPLEITKDIFASVVAGMLVFFFTSWWETVSFWLQSALITLAGYGGSKVLDMMLIDGAMPWFREFMQRVLNIKPKDGPTP